MLFSHRILRPHLTRLNQNIGAVRQFSSLPRIQYRPAPSSQSQVPIESMGRPLSPHLTIYEPQLTWLMSIGHRVTGAGLSVGIYGFGLYCALASPEAGQLTAQMASWIAHECPTALVYLGKYTVAAPMIFHTLNGIRHLVWDMGWSFSLQKVYLGGWLVNIGTLVGAGLLTLL